MRENVAEKNVYAKSVYIVRLITIRFISEHRKSCDRKTSAQSNRKNGFQKDNATFTGPQNFFCLSCFLLFRNAQLDCASLLLLGKSETCRHSLIRSYVLVTIR